MLKRPITYKDYFSGEEITEEFYFHLNETELVRIQARHGEEGLEAAIRKIIRQGDLETVITEFERIIQMAYGERDGAAFEKSEEMTRKFSNHPAYNALFIEIINDEEKAAEFMRGILPSDVAERVEQEELQKKFVERTTSNSPLRPPPLPETS